MSPAFTVRAHTIQYALPPHTPSTKRDALFCAADLLQPSVIQRPYLTTYVITGGHQLAVTTIGADEQCACQHCTKLLVVSHC